MKGAADFIDPDEEDRTGPLPAEYLASTPPCLLQEPPSGRRKTPPPMARHWPRHRAHFSNPASPSAFLAASNNGSRMLQRRPPQTFPIRCGHCPARRRGPTLHTSSKKRHPSCDGWPRCCSAWLCSCLTKGRQRLSETYWRLLLCFLLLAVCSFFFLVLAGRRYRLESGGAADCVCQAQIAIPLASSTEAPDIDFFPLAALFR